jgi:uncharacterized membrane protein HdeD (DUF308 family)
VYRVRAVTLALLFGLFALCYGVSQIAAGIQLRSAGQDVRTMLGRAARRGTDCRQAPRLRSD